MSIKEKSPSILPLFCFYRNTYFYACSNKMPQMIVRYLIQAFDSKGKINVYFGNVWIKHRLLLKPSYFQFVTFLADTSLVLYSCTVATDKHEFLSFYADDLEA